MSDEAAVGSEILYMKVGTHAQEDLAAIIARKRREIEEAGMSLWGYGGNTCHPTSMVQPFATAANGPVHLVMEPMNSRHFAEPLRAEEYSADGVDWQQIPEPINVLGSRYALCLSTLEEVDMEVDLGATQVAVGPSAGRQGDRYVGRRVDKACLKVVGPSGRDPKLVEVKYRAELVAPYAVFLRG